MSDTWQAIIATLNGPDPHAAAPALAALIAADPTHLDAREAAGWLAMGREDFAAAEAHYAAIAEGAPDRWPARLRLAEALFHQGRAGDAESALASVLQQLPGWPPALFLEARLAWDRGDYRTAVRRLDDAAMADPAVETAIDSWAHDRLLHCQWGGYDELTAYLTSRVRAGRNICQPMTLMLIAGRPADLHQCAKTETARHYPARPAVSRQPVRRDGPIRLAYLSSDYCDHPIGHQVVGVLEHHDRNDFEVIAVSFSPPTGHPVAARIRQAADRFIDVNGMDDREVAELIVEMDVDIALVLNGLTARTRPGIAAHRPAPVQVNAIGYPGTMGAPYIDYFLADRTVIPEGEERFYSEKIVFLPDTYQSTDDHAIVDAAPTRAELGLPQDAVVLAALGKTNKITPSVFDSWLRVLKAAPRAVLWLMDAGPRARGALGARALAAGISPERLVFAQVAGRDLHLARHKAADIFLDTSPYGAHSTASDALWAGLPLATFMGTTFPARVCASALRTAGLGDLVAPDLEAHERMIIDLANDPAKLAALRRRVETEVPASRLFDTAAYTRHLETAYRMMHQRRLAGLPPQSLTVEPSPGFTRG